MLETPIPLLDYSKPPPGYALEEDAADPSSGKWGAYLRDADDKETLWESEWTTGPLACAAAWAHARAHNDPLGTMRCGALGLYVTFGPGLPKFLSRTEIWAYYDRRRKIALDIAEQHLESHRATGLLAKFIRWTDAECEAVERYAALPWRERMAATMPPAFKLAMYPDSESLRELGTDAAGRPCDRSPNCDVHVDLDESGEPAC